MLIGGEVFGSEVFAKSEDTQFKLWTEKCRKRNEWAIIPSKATNIDRCVNNGSRNSK